MPGGLRRAGRRSRHRGRHRSGCGQAPLRVRPGAARGVGPGPRRALRRARGWRRSRRYGNPSCSDTRARNRTRFANVSLGTD